MAKLGDLVANAFARMVAQGSETRLRWLVSGWRRRLVLGGIFRQMPRRLDRQRAKDLEAVIDWRIRGARDGGVDRYQLVIDQGKGRVSRRPGRPPRSTIELDPLDFLRLAAGVAQGPELFMSGKLKVDGDLMFVASLPSLFRMPAARGA